MMDPSAASREPAPAQPPQPAPAAHQRLWTPWRMQYVGGGAAEAGCLFCNRLAGEDDVRSLILHRGEHAYAIMNLFPYNTGHLMLVPNQHVASPETADANALAELTALLPPVLRALRRVLRCDGFNLGMNVGAVAGAGVAEHLHQHVVPRWLGDASFMPLLASTTVLPELIPVSYAKIRAEIARELTSADAVTCVALAGGDRSVLVGDDGRLPIATAGPNEALWQAARRTIDALTGRHSQAAGWAGAVRAEPGPLALTVRIPDLDPSHRRTEASIRWVPVTEAVAGPDREIILAARANLAPAGDGA